MSFRQVTCRSLNSLDISTNKLRIQMTNNVNPLEVVNEEGEVIFSMNKMGEVFNKEQAQSFLNLSDTPKDYTNGILKIKGNEIVVEPEPEPEPIPEPEPEPEIHFFKHVNSKILNAMTLESLESKIDELKSKKIETEIIESENIKTKNIDIENLSVKENIVCPHFAGELSEVNVITALQITSGLVHTDEVIANTIQNDKLKCKELHCDNIISKMLDINEVQYGSLDEPLFLALTQQKSIDYEPCDNCIIYTKIPIGVVKQSFKILAVPTDKFLYIKGITAIGHDLNLTHNLSLVDTEYIVSINYKTKVPQDNIILRIVI